MRKLIYIPLALISISLLSAFDPIKTDTDPNKEAKKKAVEKFMLKLKEVPEYSMFMEAFEKTDLKAKLVELDTYTLLIPTNRAFQKLPGDAYQNFLKEEYLDDLEKVLSFHVIDTKLLEKEFQQLNAIKCINGTELVVTYDNKLKIEKAQILRSSNMEMNSIVYSVDEVIFPL